MAYVGQAVVNQPTPGTTIQAFTTLTGNPLATDTSIAVGSTGSFKSGQRYVIMVDSELMAVVVGDGTHFTTVDPATNSDAASVNGRGVEGSTAATHSSGASVYAPLTRDSLGLLAGVFGDANDGSVTFDGTTTILGMVPASNVYTMTRNIYCGNITINNGVTVKTADYTVFCAGKLTNNGTIDCSGNAGLANGTAGLGLGVGMFGGSATGGAGQTAAGSLGANVGAPAYGKQGASGGAGASGAGGGNGSISTFGGGVLRTPVAFATGQGPATSGTVGLLGGGSGGGGGGGDTTNKGGGGGGGGGVLVIFCYELNNAGTIQANGGAGGTPTTGNCGGGGGGGGGFVGVFYRILTALGTIQALGGTHGNGVGTGANGSDGSAGNTLVRVV